MTMSKGVFPSRSCTSGSAPLLMATAKFYKKLIDSFNDDLIGHFFQFFIHTNYSLQNILQYIGKSYLGIRVSGSESDKI